MAPEHLKWGGGVVDNNINMKVFIRRLAAFYPDDPLAEVKIQYAWDIVRSESLKCIIILAVFIILHKVDLYILGLLFLLPLRAFSGGLHFEHESCCLIFSLLTMVLGLIVFPEYIPSGKWMYLAMAVVMAVIIVISPVTSPNKPIISLQKWKRMKLFTILIAVVEALVITVLMKINDYYGYPLFWIMAIQGLQLIPGAMVYGFGKNAVKERQ